MAAPGDLDVSFSGDGKQTTDFGGSDAAAAVAVQADGKIVVAGSSGGNFALARYGADGTLDPSFSGDGLVTTDLGGTDDGQGVAIQADGKIVVAGGSGGNFALARYTAGGVLDTSFSGDGMQTTDFGAADGAPRWRSRPTAGSWSGGSPAAISRWLATTLRVCSTRRSAAMAGRPPTSVGSTPATTWRSAPTARSSPWAPTRSAERRTSRWPATPPSGALDPTFSGDGRLTTDFGRSQSTYDSGEGVAIQADGRIVVVGYGAEQTQFGGYYTRDLQLARYDTNGALDQLVQRRRQDGHQLVCGHVGLWRGA